MIIDLKKLNAWRSLRDTTDTRKLVNKHLKKHPKSNVTCDTFSRILRTGRADKDTYNTVRYYYLQKSRSKNRLP